MEGLENITTFDGQLRITDNPVLPTSVARAFADRLIDGGFTGDVTIEDNQP